MLTAHLKCIFCASIKYSNILHKHTSLLETWLICKLHHKSNIDFFFFIFLLKAVVSVAVELFYLHYEDLPSSNEYVVIK